jgi:hypothetical protein
MRPRAFATFTSAVVVLLVAAPLGSAQQASPLATAVNELKQSLAANQGALAHYTWSQRTTIFVKGEQKSQKLEQIRIGPDGQEQKTLLSSPPPPQQKRGLRGKIAEEKTDEMKEYVEQMAQLAMRYAKPAPGAVQAAFAAGNAMIGATPQQGLFDIVLKSFVKGGDSMTVSFNRQALSIVSVAVTSYLADPSDPMAMTLSFQKLPDGTNYMALGNVTGSSKSVRVQIENINFQKLAM